MLVYIHVCELGSESSLVRRPSNTAVVQGSAVTFQCTSDNSNSFIPWYRYNSTCVTSNVPSQCRKDNINSGFNLRLPQRFSMTAENTTTHVTRDLHINPVQLTDAGVYLCAERRAGVTRINSLESASAQLVVLGNKRQKLKSLQRRIRSTVHVSHN